MSALDRMDAVAFISSLINPDTGQPFVLYPAELDFFRAGLTLDDDGRLPYSDLVFSAPKKSGKTALAAMVTLWAVHATGERDAEGYCLANNLDQAQGRVFQAICRIVRATPALKRIAKILADRIEFDNGAIIVAVPADYAGQAGANPVISTFDELWAYDTERDYRLWEEMTPVPTRKVSLRLTVTYAGYSGESKLLEGLYQKAMAGEQIGTDLYRADDLLAYWTHDLRAPWQTPEWKEKHRRSERPHTFLRIYENRWVSGAEQFIPIEWWDRSASGQQVISDNGLTVVLGVDAATKRDSAAVVACTANDRGHVRLVSHRIFTPTPNDPIDLEVTLEAAIREYKRRFHVRAVRYDPYQFARSAQTLTNAGLRMEEYPQTVGNLAAMAQNLFELLKSGNFTAYPDDQIRTALQRAVAVESSRGLKITKERQSHHIDVVVAMAMAALGAVEIAGRSEYAIIYAGQRDDEGRLLEAPEVERDADGDQMWPSEWLGAPSIF